MYLYRGFRQKYRLAPNLFSQRGRLLFNDMPAIRRFLDRLNKDRKPGEQVYAGEIRACSLITDAQRHILRAYEKHNGQPLASASYIHLEKEMGSEEVLSVVESLVDCFPPEPVFSGSLTPGQYLEAEGRPHKRRASGIQDAMLLDLANDNPANKKLTSLFSTGHLPAEPSYHQLTSKLAGFCRQLPPFGPAKEDIYTFLRAPSRAHPNDLFTQLDYVLSHWKQWLPEEMVLQLLQGQDLMKEEYAAARHGGGPPPTVVPVYKKGGAKGSMPVGRSGFDAAESSGADYQDEERFTPDTDWMPRVVLMAKNTYVWLDQLSKKYQRHIHRLDQVPDQELDQLAGWHFNGLWLIGLWERSTASKKIKHLAGKADAISSAYALYDYQIAADLGGEEAYEDLHRRAWQRGIRLASDMVPNHTGIFSRWIIEQADYFIQTSEPPFPGYRFTGPDLSDHPDVAIRIEDGYYSRTDAAVVFQRVDKRNNTVRYIYHGNDGTMMPWNDTAQLDMIKAEVREAVMQKIFDVARKFSIIRFDAAMTLAKKHFARLWYPQPGTGGDIPSRASHAMTKKAFDALFPVEFWREVVDRINSEMPETLLLAEAFWFMEGYFVRSLGMHRVYNSAFMHMLKNEENEKYRDLITNTLEFEPGILKRYVNFMSNPDEETAIQQFGTGDKYFGICVLMNTLPGLPMFAHGQIEGYTEKYGMEYQRAYYHEEPQQWLMEKHAREIFPLAGMRHLFSEVDHFQLYDFLDDRGFVNENVFAFTNRHGDDKALVLYNNKYDRATGHIHISVPRLGGGQDKRLTQSTSLPAALDMRDSHRHYYVVREHVSGLQYLFCGGDIHEHGLHRSLQGFEYRVFLSFEEQEDHDGSLADLYRRLQGAGTENVKNALETLKLEPLHRAMETIFEHEGIHHFTEHSIRNTPLQPGSQDILCEHFRDFVRLACEQLAVKETGDDPCMTFSAQLNSINQAVRFFASAGEWVRPMLKGSQYQDAEDLLVIGPLSPYRENTILAISSFVLEVLHWLSAGNQDESAWYERLLLDKALDRILKHTGRSSSDTQGDKQLLRILLRHGEDAYGFTGKAPGRPRRPGKPDPLVARQRKAILSLLDDSLVLDYIGANEYQETWYYSKERFEELNRWLFSASCFAYFRSTMAGNISQLTNAIRRSIGLLLDMEELSGKAGYRLHKLRESL